MKKLVNLVKLGSMNEQSSKIRKAGLEDEKQEKGKEEGEPAPEKKLADQKADNPTETDEPPPANKQGTPAEEVDEPPAPTKKSDQELLENPHALLDPTGEEGEEESLGVSPDATAEQHEEATAEDGAQGGVDQKMVDEMGAEKGLTDHLAEAFKDFLEPGRKPKTAKDQSEEIRNAGAKLSAVRLSKVKLPSLQAAIRYMKEKGIETNGSMDSSNGNVEFYGPGRSKSDPVALWDEGRGELTTR